MEMEEACYSNAIQFFESFWPNFNIYQLTTWSYSWIFLKQRKKKSYELQKVY